MKEQMPSPEELKAIQEKHMSDEEIKMSNEREVTLEAGPEVIKREEQREKERISEKINQKIMNDLVEWRANSGTFGHIALWFKNGKKIEDAYIDDIKPNAVILKNYSAEFSFDDIARIGFYSRGRDVALKADFDKMVRYEKDEK